MSRGPGRIQQTIEAAFAANADGILYTDDLVRSAYPDAATVDKKHRVAVARAARYVCPRVGWWWMRREAPGGGIVYYNRRSVMSYGLARMRADRFENGRSDADLVAVLSGKPAQRPYTSDGNYPGLIAEGGPWHMHVAAWTAELDGRLVEAALLNAKIAEEERRINRLLGIR